MNEEQNPYLQEIRDLFHWDVIKEEAILNSEEAKPEWDGSKIGLCFLGTVFNLTPSGKYYMPWACSNVTEAEALQDELWYEALEEIANEYEMFVTSGEGDPCNIFVGICKEDN